MNARVIGLGQAAAGDDGVGFAVLDWLRRRGPRPGVELMAAREAGALVALLATERRVIIVDAVVGGGAPGAVHTLGLDELARVGLTPISSHGVGVAEVVALVALLGAAPPSVQMVAVSIARPARPVFGLSPAVAAAVPRAAARVLALLSHIAPGPDGFRLTTQRSDDKP